MASLFSRKPISELLAEEGHPNALRGVKESARANNIMVVIKLLVLTLFVVVGAMHIDTSNYVPFAPNGWRGIHQGAAIVFFAYIGFDAISTAAEETNIGTLSAFAIVCIGVLVLRYTDPSRPRPFRVPFVWPVTILGAAACIYTTFGLPGTAWKRFGIWLAIGLVLYFTYGFKHSTLRRGTPPVPITPPA